MLNEALQQRHMIERNEEHSIGRNNKARRENGIDVKTAVAAAAGARDYLGVGGMCSSRKAMAGLFSLDFVK